MIERKTLETDIRVKVRNDKVIEIDSGNGFFNHLLKTLFFYAGIGIEIKVKGDFETGYHHSVEDLGIVIGKLFRSLIEQASGFNRYSSIYSPMDEALVLLVIDVSNRPYLNYQVDYSLPYIAQLPLELIREFLVAFVNNSRVTLHIKKIEGIDSHHIAEAIFKGLGRQLKEIFDTPNRELMSTKGVIYD
jgi:imidazoleglycerol-phosphate dehydratase